MERKAADGGEPAGTIRARSCTADPRACTKHGLATLLSRGQVAACSSCVRSDAYALERCVCPGAMRRPKSDSPRPTEVAVKTFGHPGHLRLPARVHRLWKCWRREANTLGGGGLAWVSGALSDAATHCCVSRHLKCMPAVAADVHARRLCAYLWPYLAHSGLPWW
jgi:hypothetical protein